MTRSPVPPGPEEVPPPAADAPATAQWEDFAASSYVMFQTPGQKKEPTLREKITGACSDIMVRTVAEILTGGFFR